MKKIYTGSILYHGNKSTEKSETTVLSLFLGWYTIPVTRSFYSSVVDPAIFWAYSNLMILLFS
jgi:hypothetical protein